MKRQAAGGAGTPVVVSLALLCALATLQFALFLRGGDSHLATDDARTGTGDAPAMGKSGMGEALPDALPPLEPLESPFALQRVPPLAPAQPSPVGVDPASPPSESQANQTSPQADPAAISSDEARALVTDAIRLRRQGDMAGAVGKLESAISLAPGHPRVLFESGITYESMGLTDRALARFQSVVNLGPVLSGSLFEIAQRRLAEGAETPDRGKTDTEAVHLGDVRETVVPATRDGQAVTLTIDLHALPGHLLSNDDLAVIVKFFDRVGGGRIEASRAPAPATRWLTMPVDWADPSIETLEVAHFLPTPPQQEEQRTYFGYLIELYYQDVLMDVLAHPRRLARYQVEDSPGGYLPGLDSLLGGGLPDSLEDLGFPADPGFPRE